MNSGFTFCRFLEQLDWKVLSIDRAFTLDKKESCRACGVSLDTVATLVGKKNGIPVRVGCCPRCGYVGYKDVPSPEWFRSFYSDGWDHAGRNRDLDAFVADMQARPRQKYMKRVPELEKRIFSRLALDTKRPICEIGCGYGGTLKGIRDLGFQNVIGIETSLHRAAVAERAYGIPVITSLFESDDAQNALRARAPFSLIFSYHVLEHVRDPKEVIGRCASLQDEGDYLLLSMPNFWGEFSMGVLLFLPHLHSFTPQSIAALLCTCGYEVIGDWSSSRNTYCLARKKNAAVYNEERRDFRAAVVQKIERGLGIGVSYTGRMRRLWWYRTVDVGGQDLFFENETIEALHHPVRDFFNRIGHRSDFFAQMGRRNWVKKVLLSRQIPLQSCVVSNLGPRFTDPHESPIEIQFPEETLMTYK